MAARVSLAWLAQGLLCLYFACLASSDADGQRKAAEIALIQAFDKLGHLKLDHPLEKDVFNSLTEGQQHLWAYHDSSTVNASIDGLLDNRVHVYVDVKLVGFNGDGNQQVSIQESDLSRFFHAFTDDLESVALDSGLPMIPKPWVMFRVWKANKRLVDDITAAISVPVKTQIGGGSPQRMVEISYQVVEQLVREDFLREQHSVFTIYLLNPRQPVAPYLYNYGPGGCPGQLWVGSEPYVWVDLTAGPSRYGPGPGSKGIVLPHNIPRLAHYKKAYQNQALLPDLTAFSISLTKHLFWPPLQHSVPKRSAEVAVHLVYLHEDLVGGRSALGTAALQEVLQGMLAGVQAVKVSEHFLPYAHCEYCTAALTGALKVQTRRARGKTVTLERLDYLDSSTMHTWMTTYADYILSHAGVHVVTEDGLPSALPVFIFDLSTNQNLLLDGERLAVGFDNMVLAVATRAGQDLSRHTCNAGPVFTEPGRDLPKALTAAILQSGWAVTDPALSWHPAAGAVTNSLLHVGSTPFGLLSRTPPANAPPDYPFSLGHAARRNVLLAELNNSLTHAVTIMRGFAKLTGPDGQFGKALQGTQQARFRMRVHLMHFKAQEAMQALTRRDPRRAYLLAASMRHDVDHLHRLAKKVNKEHHLALVCPKHPLAWTIWLLPLGCVVGVAAAVYAALSAKEDSLRNW